MLPRVGAVPRRRAPHGKQQASPWKAIPHIPLPSSSPAPAGQRNKWSTRASPPARHASRTATPHASARRMHPNAANRKVAPAHTRRRRPPSKPAIPTAARAPGAGTTVMVTASRAGPAAEPPLVALNIRRSLPVPVTMKE